MGRFSHTIFPIPCILIEDKVFMRASGSTLSLSPLSPQASEAEISHRRCFCSEDSRDPSLQRIWFQIDSTSRPQRKLEPNQNKLSIAPDCESSTKSNSYPLPINIKKRKREELNMDVEVENLHDSSDDNSDAEWERQKKLIFITHEVFTDTYRLNEKQPCRTSVLRGPMWVDELLRGHPTRIWENLKIRRSTFIALYELLLERGYWTNKQQQQVDVRESLAIFLHTVSRNQKHTDLAERFQHSTETTSRHVKKMSRCLVQLAPELICPRYFTTVHPKIRNDSRFYPWFKGCIGAIDGTCISAAARGKRQESFRNRKASISQNVLAVVDHDMRFIFVHSGWEGSAHDGRVFLDAISRPELGFPYPPEGKYYLVDSGYSNQPGYLAPYRGENYHRDRFVGHTTYRGPRELFNHRHSSIRNVVERTFGVLKKRFGILKGPMPPYKTARQGTLVLACCVVHNFIRNNDIEDDIFARLNDVDAEVSDSDEDEELVQIDPPRLVQPPATTATLRSWSNFRDSIANELWTS